MTDNPFSGWNAYTKPAMRRESPQPCADCGKAGKIFTGSHSHPAWHCVSHAARKARRENKWGGKRNWGHQRNG